MQASLINVLLAAAPPLVVLILMVGFRWGGSKAGPAGWFVAVTIAIMRFGAGLDVVGYAHVRSLVLTVDVVYIVWTALLLYHIVDEAGALTVIADWFTQLTSDDVLRVLLLGWVFTSFLQGVGGFGVPVAVVAPLLVGLGLAPLAAVVVPSVGHAWAVTFGSLGSSFLALIGVTGMDADVLAPPAAILLGMSALTCGLLAAHAYAGWRGVRRGLPVVIAVGSVMAVVQYVLATNGLWNIGAAGGGLAGLILMVSGLKLLQRGNKGRDLPEPAAAEAANPGDNPSGVKQPSFLLAISGYMILVVLAFLIKGVDSVKQFFGGSYLGLPVPEVSTSLGWVTEASPSLGLNVFGHTGAILLYSALITYGLYRWQGVLRHGASRRVIQGTLKKGVSPAVGIISMVGMATTMSNVGMTRTLAEWLSQAVPPGLYAFVATAIGSLGAFMTGSNTNSNAVFGALQMDTAVLLGLSVMMVLGVQTASAAIASLLAPAKIIVGASTVGLGGDEGTVLRKLLLYGGILLLVIATVSFIFLQMGY